MERGSIEILVNCAGFGISGAVEFTESKQAKAQFDVEKYDKECFLVRTLDEYMGYDRTFEVKGEDAFYQRVENIG